MGAVSAVAAPRVGEAGQASCAAAIVQAEAEAVIRCDNLTLGYNRHPAVHHLTCTIPAGTLLAVVGPNGGGKSTLLKALAGLLPPLQGSVSVAAGGRVAYLPQLNELDSRFPVNVFDMVAGGLWHRCGAFGGVRGEDRDAVAASLHRVGLGGLERRPIGALSGGQLQRARFARLILQDAALMLLDEPFNAIDKGTTDDLTALLLEWHAEGRTVLAVLHDIERVRRVFPHSLLLARECFGFGATTAVLGDQVLEAARRHAGRIEEHAPVCERPQ